MLWRIWLWLRRFFSRPARIAVVPEGACRHDVDSEATMRRLLLACSDPAKFAQELAQFANCPACSTAVVAQLSYELAGFVLLDQEDGESAEWVGCQHTSVVPEIIAMRLTLAREANDGDVLAATLSEVLNCPDCAAAVILSLLNAHVSVLNTTNLAWQPMVQRHLLTLLDKK